MVASAVGCVDGVDRGDGGGVSGLCEGECCVDGSGSGDFFSVVGGGFIEGEVAGEVGEWGGVGVGVVGVGNVVEYGGRAGGGCWPEGCLL